MCKESQNWPSLLILNEHKYAFLICAQSTEHTNRSVFAVSDQLWRASANYDLPVWRTDKCTANRGLLRSNKPFR